LGILDWSDSLCRRSRCPGTYTLAASIITWTTHQDADRAQFFTAIAPPGKTGVNNAEGFFKSYLAFPIVIAFWIFGFVWKRTGWLRLDQIDVDTGRRELDWDQIRAYREHIKSLPTWRRWLNKLF